MAVKIFFGSQSGTAECFSEELRDEASQQGIDAEVVDLITFTPESFQAVKIAVLVVSTYGEGEPTDNAVEFHKWAGDPRHDGALKGQRFTVMGLGDMNYSRFNNMGMECDQFLERLGGARIYQRGVGDDSQDIAADFQKWKNGGLWAALKNAVAEVQQEIAAGGGIAVSVASATPVAVAPPKLQLTIFYGHDAEADGAAKDVCEAINGKLQEASKDLNIAGVHSLQDRKTIEVVRKLPKKSLAFLVVDCGPDGLCSAGRKLVRNMSLEFDSLALAEKDIRYAFLTVASSKCNNSARSLKDQIKQAGEGIPKACDRVGMKPVEEKVPTYLDAGVEDVTAAVKELCDGIGRVAAASKPAAGLGQAPGGGAAVEAAKTNIICAGGEAKEAGEALVGVWPGGNACVEDASLMSLAAAAKGHAQVVLAIECAANGDLSDEARGLLVQLNAAPMVVKQQLKQLRFAALVIAATDYGNAGERASVRGAHAELTQQAAPVVQALAKFGAVCVSSNSADLQDSDPTKLSGICNTFQAAFKAQSASKPAAAVLGAGVTAPASAVGNAVLRMASSSSELPPEAPGDAADVLSRFFFEADRAKVLKVRELRQTPNAAEGLSTAEVEIEANGSLKSYTLGGTLSVLPESDPADVAAALKLMGLAEADLGKSITFAAVEGPGFKIKKPFPTPCTLREALACYCDLARAPTKKMLTAVQTAVKDESARDRLGKLLADNDAVKALSAAPLCCRMHEFWAMLGVASIDASTFLQHCPRQKAREFTIASSPKASPDRIALCVSLTSHEVPSLATLAEQLKACGCLPDNAATPESRPRFFGSCSSFVTSRMKVGGKVLAKFRPSAFHLPEKDVPVIMVGAGAGVAPFRGFWEELRRGPQTAPAALFFGCRHPDQDWLYKDEMNSAVKRQTAAACAALARVQAAGPKKPLTCLYTAFSRPADEKQKKYVQDHVRENAASVKHWIQNMSGYVFVCGSTAMGNGVLDALADILEGGKDTVETLRKEGRIVAEMWG